MSINHDDILDLRTLADNWRELLDQEEGDRAEDWQADVTAYADLAGELGCDPTPDGLEHQGDMYDPTLISDDHFTEYAKELAEDIGAVDRDATWPNQYIDWDAAADALRVDYNTVNFDGQDYLIRF